MPKPNKTTFVSYVQPSGSIPEPQLLPGELVITVGTQALRFIPYSEQKQGVSGTIAVTNFKISFRTVEQQPASGANEHVPYSGQRNKLYNEDDIVLNNVEAIYQVSKGRKKRLVPGMGSSGHVKAFEIHCKDFQIHSFSLKATPKDEAKMVVNAIVHHTMPLKHDLLFAFDYQGDTQPDEGTPQVPRYNSKWDWEAEIKRLQATGFTVYDGNNNYRLSESLPEAFVIPSALQGAGIVGGIQQFVNYRCPTWSYSHTNGTALVRMAYLIPDTLQRDLEDKVLDAVKLSHPKTTKPKVYNVHQLVPGSRDIRINYEKLRELCMPATLKEVESSDISWYSSLDNTHWLPMVGTYLRTALRVADVMNGEGRSVIIKEEDSRELTPVITSLVQLMLDPQSRTLEGFQGLVEREWVAMGHRFKDKLGLVYGALAEASPVFLLFLDCVYQLLHQFPSAFQFSEMYLTSIWDSVCLGLFDNFLFNSIRERSHAKSDKRVHYGSVAGRKLMSVWDWSKQFSPEDIALFNNPLYKTRTELDLCANKLNNGPHSHTGQGKYSLKLSGLSVYEPQLKPKVLRPVVSAALMQFWSHCYLRWLTPVQILSGGTPSEYLQQCILVEEVICLQHQIKSMENSMPFMRAGRPKSNLIFETSQDTSTPRRTWSEGVTSSFPYTPARNPTQVSYFETPLSRYLESSFVYEPDSLSLDGLNDSLEVSKGQNRDSKTSASSDGSGMNNAAAVTRDVQAS